MRARSPFAALDAASRAFSQASREFSCSRHSSSCFSRSAACTDCPQMASGACTRSYMARAAGASTSPSGSTGMDQPAAIRESGGGAALALRPALCRRLHARVHATRRAATVSALASEISASAISVPGSGGSAIRTCRPLASHRCAAPRKARWPVPDAS
jgi:hypothetical protein